MRRLLPIVCAALLGSCAVHASVQRASEQVGPAFEGSWRGHGTQSNPPSEWTIALTVAGGGRGSVVGTIAYPSLACGGDLILRAAASDRLELLERITYGGCVDRGIVTLTPAAGGLAFDWREQQGPMTGRGMLARATPPVGGGH